METIKVSVTPPEAKVALRHPLPLGGGRLTAVTVQSGAATETHTPPQGYYGFGSVRVTGDANLAGENIKSGVTILGVTGTYAGSGGGGESDAVENDVTFIDYDGTVLHGYSAAEFAELSAMPTAPAHEGLTAQGWNWTLADAKAYVAQYGSLWIGQQYITDDGKTRLYIRLGAERLSPVLGLCPNGTVTVDWGDGSSGTVTGESTETPVDTQHDYAAAGEYVITLTVSGTLGIVGTSGAASSSGLTDTSFGSRLLWKASETGLENNAYQSSLIRVELGSGITGIGDFAFANCFRLKSITIPASVTGIGEWAFYRCFNLAGVSLPSGPTSIGDRTFCQCCDMQAAALPGSLTSIGNYSFSNCTGLGGLSIPDAVTALGKYAIYTTGVRRIALPGSIASCDTYSMAYNYRLERVTTESGASLGANAFAHCYNLASAALPEGTTSIGSGIFNFCRSLSSVEIPSTATSIGTTAFSNNPSLTGITIPASVTSIAANAFVNCYGLREIHMMRTTPPTLSNANALSNHAADRVIYVPQGCLTAYQAAANWRTYASYMQEEP